MIFDNVNKKNLASSSDAEDISNETDSGDVVRFLVENDSEDEIKYAVAGEDSTIRVTDSDSVADIYVGSGKDIINNATENDVVNIFNTKPNQITKVEATTSQIKFSFSDFGSLTINSSENVGINYQGTIYQLDRQNITWSKK